MGKKGARTWAPGQTHTPRKLWRKEHLSRFPHLALPLGRSASEGKGLRMEAGVRVPPRKAIDGGWPTSSILPSPAPTQEIQLPALSCTPQGKMPASSAPSL